jgi:hypothetical protein
LTGAAFDYARTFILDKPAENVLAAIALHPDISCKFFTVIPFWNPRQKPGQPGDYQSLEKAVDRSYPLLGRSPYSNFCSPPLCFSHLLFRLICSGPFSPWLIKIWFIKSVFWFS